VEWADASAWPLPRTPADLGEGPGDPGEDTAEEAAVFRELELPEIVQQVADLGLRVEGRGELGGAWRRFRPCEPGSP
jgi:hypothetical protein